MYKTFLQGQLKYDARMPGRDVKLTIGEPPAAGDPRLATYLEMQSETRSLLGLLLWVSLAYPQISYHVNRACGFMSNPRTKSTRMPSTSPCIYTNILFQLRGGGAPA